MKALVYSTAAEDDIDTIIDLIKADNPAAAQNWLVNLDVKCRQLARFPHMGKRRDDVRDGVHCFPHGNYLIFYDIGDTSVVVLHVVHGARNLPEIFRREEGE